MQTTPETSTRLRLSLAACALVVATSTAESSARPAAEVQAGTTVVGQYDESAILKKIQAYCIRSWLNAGIPRQEWDDCTQDVYLRLLSRLPGNQLSVAIHESESDARRELNRAIWTISQRRRRARPHASLTGDAVPAIDSDTCSAHSESVQLIRHAIESTDSKLSPIQRRILNQWSTGETIRNFSWSASRPSTCWQ